VEDSVTEIAFDGSRIETKSDAGSTESVKETRREAVSPLSGFRRCFRDCLEVLLVELHSIYHHHCHRHISDEPALMTSLTAVRAEPGIKADPVHRESVFEESSIHLKSSSHTLAEGLPTMAT
jgi:hypothetical protein